LLRRNRIPIDKLTQETNTLQRHIDNPVIKPKLYGGWESVGTFNPAAIKDNEGFVHLLYRAIGEDGLSRIGYAKSRDGLKFADRSAYPVYVSMSTRNTKSKKQLRAYDPNIYTSGGGWGGCEDPRAVVIDGRVYMTYTAFEGWDSVRMVLTSISVEDLKKGHWNWKRPRFISAPGEVNKNWVLFPEKIKGKFAVLHSVSPEIKIDYLDSVYDEDNKHIKSSPPHGGRPGCWDNWVRGAGPPPIRTKVGWLLLYHAMDKNDPNKYKLGCMVLDLNEPTKILYRANEPILEPDMPYENDWKPGVVYASGALVIGHDLVVYYGGGDKYVCVAKTPLQPLLDWLVTYGKV
jgi:predicted GH43/DUF377 family glycosyl hydrolase